MSEQPKIYLTSLLGPDLTPVRATPQSVGLDLRAPYDIYLPPGTEMFVDTGIVVDPREVGGTHAEIRTRSSSAKIQLTLANTLGTIDPDYCGFNPSEGKADTLRVWLRRAPLAPVLTPGTAPLRFEDWTARFKERLLEVKERDGVVPGWDPDTFAHPSGGAVFRLEDPAPGKTCRAMVLLPRPSRPYIFPGVPILMFEKGGPVEVTASDLTAYEAVLPAYEGPDQPLFRRGERFAQVVFIDHASPQGFPVQELSPEEFFARAGGKGERGGFGQSGVR